MPSLGPINLAVDLDLRPTIEPVLRAACDAAVAALAGVSAAARDNTEGTRGAEVEVRVVMSDQPVIEVRVTFPHQGA